MSPQTKRFVGAAMIIAALFLPVFDVGTPEILLMITMLAAGIWLVRRSSRERAEEAVSTTDRLSGASR